MNAKIQKGLFQDINEQRAEISGEAMSKLSERESNTWGKPKRKMIKEKRQLPAGLGQAQCRISNKAGGWQCLIKLLRETLNQQWLPGRVRQGCNHYRLPRSHQRKMEKESLEE